MFFNVDYSQQTAFMLKALMCKLIKESYKLTFLSQQTKPFLKKLINWAFLVIRWLRIRLAMQETPVWYLVLEDLICQGAPRPVRYSHWARALECCSHSYSAHEWQLPKPRHLSSATREKPPWWEAWASQPESSPGLSPQLEKAHT